MSHLAVDLGLVFAVEVGVPVAGLGQVVLEGIEILAENIDHERWLEEPGLGQVPVADGPDMEVELREVTGFNGVVAAIMGARGQFIDQNTPFCR